MRRRLTSDQARTRRRKIRRGPARDWRYRAFVRQHACVACGSLRFVEAAHTGPHGLSSKASDYQCIPLCGWCHTGKSGSLRQVGPVQFERAHGISFGGVIERLLEEWDFRRPVK
jgi:hypothetical protein